jgi:signal transduction histidine kinase
MKSSAAIPAARMAPTSARRRVFAVAAAGVGAVGAVLAFGLIANGGLGSVVQLAALPAGAFALVTCSYAALRSTGRLRRAWIIMALTTASLGVGNVIYAVLTLEYGNNLPFPSAADAFFILSYPLAIAGILTFPSAPGRNATRGRALLDGVTIAISLFFISWALGLGSVYSSSASDVLSKSVGLAYPIGDVLIATALLSATSRAPRSLRGPLLLALVGLGLNATADSAFAFLTATGSLSTGLGNIVAGIFVMGYLTFGLGALHPAATSQTGTPEGATGMGRVSVPWISALAVTMASGLILVTGGRLDRFLAVPAAGLFVLLMTSQLITHGDSLSLLKKSEETEAQVEKLSLAKSKVMSMVSHEFRNALVGIQGFSELMRDNDLPPEDVKTFAADIYNDSERLTRMINEMLDLDRLEAGRVELDLKPVDLNAKIREAVERAHLSSDKCTIGTDLDSALPLVDADPDRLYQVISNLLSNALKYSPDGGEILITTATQDHHVRVAVKDHGRGMQPEAMEHLFQRYERVDENQGEKVSGTGLGLVIAREIVEMHGGKIWAVSAAGSGSEFIFTIPIPAGAVVALPPQVGPPRAA